MKFLALGFKEQRWGRVPKADPEHLNKGDGDACAWKAPVRRD